LNNFRSWVEVDAAAIHHNLRSIRSNLPSSVALAPVIKANAYGHGIDCLAQILPSGQSLLCVDSLDEAQKVREFRGLNEPILIMGYIPVGKLESLDTNMLPVVYETEHLEVLAEFRPSQNVHVKIETGLNRQGVALDDLSDFLQKVDELGLKIVGAYTHYANVEDTLDTSFFELQYEMFRKSLKLFSTTVKIHSCASAAALLHPNHAGEFARVGISMYGHYSSWQTYLSLRERGVHCDLKPALSWKCKIAQIKSVKTGDKVGYGCSYEVLRPGKIAILPVGYYDGYSRMYSGKSVVLVNGRRAPVVGRIAMNMCMVDVSHIDGVSAGQIVTLLGQDESSRITAEELAEISQTITYEALTRIASHLPRVITNLESI
tara:strand:+ start:2318 stop:3442 length:1125 start_codon:yes stop_codon:yes gene_type:complete